jgi:hypothetical protein
MDLGIACANVYTENYTTMDTDTNTTTDTDMAMAPLRRIQPAFDLGTSIYGFTLLFT